MFILLLRVYGNCIDLRDTTQPFARSLQCAYLTLLLYVVHPIQAQMENNKHARATKINFSLSIIIELLLFILHRPLLPVQYAK